MSKAKVEIYYIGDESERETALKLQENLAKHSNKNKNEIALLEFSVRSREIPEEIILLAHSDDTRQYIGNLTAGQLSQKLAAQFKGKDLSLLKSIKLVSCEGGFGAQPLAQQVAEALYKRGFKNAVVKAATHPKESKIGGVVSVTTRPGTSMLTGNEPGMVSAIMYGNQKTADYLQWNELKRIRGRTNQQESQMRALAAQYHKFTGFNEQSVDFCLIKLLDNIEDLDAPQNCYTHSGVQAVASLDAVIALDFLRSRKRLHAIQHHKTEVEYYAQLIKKIEDDPSQKQAAILALLDAKVGGISSNWRKGIKKELSEFLNAKNAAMNLHQSSSKTETIAQKIEGDEEYLARMLQKDSFFDKIWRSIYGAEEFINELRIGLKHYSTEMLYAKAEREDLIALILSQQEKDIEAGKLTETSTHMKFSNILSTNKKVIQEQKYDTPLKDLYAELKTYCGKPNPTAADWTAVHSAKKVYDATQNPEKKSRELENLIGRLVQNNKKISDLKNGVGIIKHKVNAAINSYLQKFDRGDKTDVIHKPKVAVMKAMQQYASEPSEKNWEALETTAKNNVGWDKGWFSKVRFFMHEVNASRKELLDETERVSSAFTCNS
ncbi:hypothetical protein [Legionella quinlivanii]|uniref:hypothetical protein n=1 Tax=Legionella quinlivanii TaxID=45073 RepID=UPI0022431A67|nr:hypothetical protein [Legionella quinlivanii]MCW8451581.1 hypothetical protein [Legionella quinlivanii]